MNKLWIVGSILFLASCAGGQAAESMQPTAELRFQHDADLIRLEHLVYWTALLEEYESKVGYYPFQQELLNSQDIGLVKIA